MKSILLLHGALGSIEDLRPLEQGLSNQFAVHCLQFDGHGGQPVTNNFSIEFFASQVLSWMDEQQIEKIIIAGYSLGGYVGLYLALIHPERVEKLVTIGTKLYWDTSVAEREVSRLNADVIVEQYPELANELQRKHHSDHWRSVLQNTASMLQHIGRFNPVRFNDFSTIHTPVLLILGDRDKMVSFVETTTAYRELPAAQLAVLPATGHAIANLHIPLLSTIIGRFADA